MADSEKGGTHFGFVLYDQKGDLAYRSGTPTTRKLSRAETSGGERLLSGPRRLGQLAGRPHIFVIWAKDVPRSAYKLRKLLPERDGELQYRIKNAAEDHERVAGESNWLRFN
jgi:hypothetical protein